LPTVIFLVKSSFTNGAEKMQLHFFKHFHK
jgi:hypothetical protein